MALMWTFLLLLALSDVCLAVSIKFERAPSFPTDDFLLPDSLCPSFRPSCNLFNAHQLGGCWCSCPSTFSFYEHNFKCAKNSEARQSAGCELLFTDQADDSSMPFFPSSSVRQKTIKVPENQNCSFYFKDQLHINYLRCDGTWKSQNLANVVEVTPGWSISQLSIKLKPGSSLPQTLAGRLVRIAIQCGARNSYLPFKTTCVMFKVEGIISCSYPQSTPAPSQAIATLPTPITRPKKPTTSPPPNPTQPFVSLHNHEDTPINCVLGSTVVFKISSCDFLPPVMFNCCRQCNYEHSTCIETVDNEHSGGQHSCYRGSYKCMCKCLETNNPPENYYR